MNTPIPRAWSKHVKTGILHAISLARMEFVIACGPAARSRDAFYILSHESTLSMAAMRVERLSSPDE